MTCPWAWMPGPSKLPVAMPSMLPSSAKNKLLKYSLEKCVLVDKYNLANWKKSTSVHPFKDFCEPPFLSCRFTQSKLSLPHFDCAPLHLGMSCLAIYLGFVLTKFMNHDESIKLTMDTSWRSARSMLSRDQAWRWGHNECRHWKNACKHTPCWPCSSAEHPPKDDTHVLARSCKCI